MTQELGGIVYALNHTFDTFTAASGTFAATFNMIVNTN